jgi:alpha-L-fucosidase 2
MIRTFTILLLASNLASAEGLVRAPGMHNDIEFGKGGDGSLTMDAYIPPGDGPFSAVVVVHGGGWRNGDKRTYVPPLFDPLTKGGFAWFTVNYRLAPAHHFPAPIDDVETAIRHIQAHAREYKVDVKRLAITGESAGGHIVSFIGARDGQKLGLRAVVPFYAPNDLDVLATQRTSGNALVSLQGLLGFTELDDEAHRRLREASPVNYVKKGMPPFLIIHGTGDQLVPFAQAGLMCDKIRQAGGSCEVFPVDGAPHGIGPWEKNPAFQDYKVKMIDWLKQQLRVDKP